MKNPKTQQGFVLIGVLILVLVISAIVMIILNQQGSDVKSSIRITQHTKQLIAAKQATDEIWQSPSVHLTQMALLPNTWLGKIIHQASSMQSGITSLHACGDLSRTNVGYGDGQYDGMSMQCADKIWWYGYATAIDASHYLVKSHQYLQVKPNDGAGITSLPGVQQLFFQIDLYAVAMASTATLSSCQTHSMYQHQALKCMIDAGVHTKSMAMQWLAITTQMPDMSPSTIEIIPIKKYELRLVRD